MAQNVCRGCMKPLLSISNAKNIFIDDFNLHESGKSVKICVAIEQITGEKVLKTNSLPDYICEICFKKLDVCLSFRTQLLHSFNSLFRNQTNLSVNSTLEVKSKSALVKNSNVDENMELTKVNIEDQINVDEDSSSSNEISEDEGIIRSMREEQDNNNFNSPDSPVVDINSYTPKDPVRNMDNDIESDIDVCSGEDDEILELDIDNAKSETIDLDNSSGSDIDVCDYEPSGKRIKNYNALSPPVQF